MSMKKMKTSAFLSAVALSMGSSLYAVDARADWSANIGVFSQYVLRGITNNAEDDSVAIQGGVDYAAESGLYAGYWGSSLDYSSGAVDSNGDGFENDFYAGYAGSAGMLNYNLGLIYYAYLNVNDSDAAEVAGSLGVGPVTLGAKYLTKDVAWGNQGDTYWTLAYGTELPKGFKFNALLGYYTYEDKGKFISSSTEDAGFRHLDLTLAHPIGETGADASITYVVGGEDRNGVNQDDAIVFGVKYAFGF